MPKASVNVQRGRLYLLARLPRKDGKPGTTPQRIPTGLFDTPADHRIADRQRVTLQKQLDRGLFSWEDWAPAHAGTTWKKAIDLLYRKRVVNGRTGETTWQVNFMGRLRQAPMTQAITPQGVTEFISRWPRDTCSYKEAFYLLKDMCGLVNVPFPELPVPTYTTGQIKEVPDDSEIISVLSDLQGPFVWHLGMMATFGLRPSETLGCKFLDDKHRLQVDEKTKTGFRVVIPCPAEWVELFGLRDVRRREGRGLTQWLFNERKKAGFTWKPYALRHAYAGRLWRVGGSRLDAYTAARLMGHSLAEHTKTYRQFIDPITVAHQI